MNNQKGNDALTAFLAGCVIIPVLFVLVVLFATYAYIIVPVIGVGIAAWCGLLIIRDWDNGER